MSGVVWLDGIAQSRENCNIEQFWTAPASPLISIGECDSSM